MIKSVSKIVSFFIALINIFFFYIWAAVFYVLTAISSLLSRVPFLSLFAALFDLLGSILGKVILWLWLVFDYIVLFIRELLLPMLVKIYTFVKNVLVWIWKKLKILISWLIPRCKPFKKYCLQFDKAVSYAIAGLPVETMAVQNRAYELSIRTHFQEEVNKLSAKESQTLLKLYKKASLSKKDKDIYNYNVRLSKMQIAELNIMSNYRLSIEQHRLILLRNCEFIGFDRYLPLLLEANHFSFIHEKAFL